MDPLTGATYPCPPLIVFGMSKGISGVLRGARKNSSLRLGTKGGGGGSESEQARARELERMQSHQSAFVPHFTGPSI